MPNIITHAFLAHDALEAAHCPNLSRLIAKHPRVYAMGSSGPDFLFYYKALPWQKKTPNDAPAREVGSRVHTEKISAFYETAITVIEAETDALTKEIMTVFLAGHLTHWSLDTIAHPYVFYFTGEISGATKYWHFRFESMLDTLMITEVKGFKIENIKMPEFVSSTPVVRQAVAKLYKAIVDEVLNLRMDESVYIECLATMESAAKLLYDPYTLKFPAVQLGEKAAKQLWAFSGHMVIGEPDRKHDILNLSHTPWVHPCDDTKVSTASFPELYQEGVERAVGALSALEDVLSGTQPIRALTLITRDLTYDTGLANPSDMMHYRPIYETV